MPSSTEPDTGLTRMTTRSKNATTHPGTMALDALRVRRRKEEVAEEKKLKNAQKEAKKEKRIADEAKKTKGKIYIARLKAEQATAAANTEREIPRRRPVTQGEGNKGLGGSPLTPLPTSPMSQVEKRAITRQNNEDSDVETSPPLKRAKVGSIRSLHRTESFEAMLNAEPEPGVVARQPLRRTETTLAMVLYEEQMGTRYRALTDEAPTDVDMEDDPTPQPRKTALRLPHTEGNKTSSDEEPFRTPLAQLRRKRTPSPDESSGLSEGGPAATKKQVGMTKGKARVATRADEMRNRGDNYAADEERSNDLPSDPESNPTAVIVASESELRIVNQKKADGKRVAEASRKEHGPLAVDKSAHLANTGDSNVEDSQLHGTGFKKHVVGHNRGSARPLNKIDLAAKSTRVTRPSHSTSLAQFAPRLTTSNTIVAAKHLEPASEVTTKAPVYTHSSKPISRATLAQSTDDRTSKSTRSTAMPEPVYDHPSKLTRRDGTQGAYDRPTTGGVVMQEPVYHRTSRPTSRAATQEPGNDHPFRSTGRAATPELAYARTSKPTSRAITQEPVHHRMSKSTGRASTQEPGNDHPFRSTGRAATPELAYARTSKPTSRAVTQEPVHHRTSRPTSRAETQEPVHRPTSKSTSRAATQEPRNDRLSRSTGRAAMPELAYVRISKPTSRTVTREPVSDHEDYIPWSEEDDTRDKEAAMSSPLKGSELRAEAKFIKFKEPEEAKTRKRPSIQDLPEGANDDCAWTCRVVPNFINLILAGEHPWLIADNIIVSELQRVWNHVYGNRVSFTIEKKSVPFDLVVQKLWEYRNKLAYKAVCTVFSYYCSEVDDGANVNDDSAELAKFAKSLLTEHSFVFKGMENLRNPKKNGTFKHILIIETLSAHFSGLTEGPPLNGVKIGEPQLSLALTAAAVERALQLFANEMIEERVDTKGKHKFVVRKLHHPNTGKLHSRTVTEFSATGWNQATMDFLDSVQELGDKRLRAILDDAKSHVKGKNKVFLAMKPKSTRSALHSDSDETGMLEAYAAEVDDQNGGDDFY